MTTILVADDEPPILELIRFTLEDDQMRVVEARGGLEALRLAQSVRPELCFLDVRMPDLDGLALCRLLRQDPALAGSRIIMLTAASQEADRALGLAAGADGYLTKPFSPLALFSLVRSLLPEAVAWPDT
jgi:two-component system alkaline phosphatase synthesis response regulator PhoP